jgi:hypothetical protein
VKVALSTKNQSINQSINQLIEYNKTTSAFEVGNLSYGLRQTQTCGGVKPVNVIPTQSQVWFYRAPLFFNL